MNEFEQARRKYRPQQVKLVLIVEAPPSEGSGRFFYFESVSKGDSLFLETMKALYPDARGDAPRIRARKAEFLRRFQADGFYLLDACPEPIPGKARSLKLRCIRNGLEHLESNLVKIDNPDLKVILISSTVYEVCFQPLLEAGWNVINSEMIDFPGSGRQTEFQKKFRRLMGQIGWRHS